MIFEDLPLCGALRVLPEAHADERGFFARVYCRDEFGERGLAREMPQCSVSFNRRRGTLRGMHFQADPHPEVKLVRCTGGAIYDVIVDLRPDSPTYCRWHGEELTAANRAALYIPAGFAHGFLTLSDDAEVYYMIATSYRPELARGVRWDDPVFGIDWPGAPVVMSERDRGYPDFQA